jgi:hypothetical protein
VQQRGVLEEEGGEDAAGERWRRGWEEERREACPQIPFSAPFLDHQEAPGPKWGCVWSTRWRCFLDEQFIVLTHFTF